MKVLVLQIRILNKYAIMTKEEINSSVKKAREFYKE